MDNKIGTRGSHNIAAVAAILAVSLVVMGKQLLVPSVYSCWLDDTVYYMNWARQVTDALASGVIYPRWIADSHGGFGNPVFIFYPPLAVYLTALVKLASGNIITAVTAVKFAGLLLSGMTMFIFARDLWGNRAGIAAAAAYIVLPYRVFDLHIMGWHASKLAYFWFPLVMHFSGKAASEDKVGRNTALLGVSYAGLCLTHLLSAYMITPVALAFALVRAEKGRSWAAALRAAAGLGLGMSVAAFYLLPVLRENGLVHFEMLLSRDIFNYRNNFLFYVFTPEHPIMQPIHDYLTMTVKSSAAAGLAFFAAYLTSREGRRSEPVFFLAVTAAALFLMSSLSSPVWKYTPGMKMLQFTARWAPVAVFALSCLVGAGAGRLSVDTIRKRPLYHGLAVAVIIAASAWAGYYDFDIITRGCRYSAQDVAAFPADMDVLEYVPNTVSLDWLRKQKDLPEKPSVSSLNPEVPVGIDIKEWKSEERRFNVDTDEDVRISVRTFNYPGWRAFIDGEEAPIATQDVSGAMIIDLPEGSHEVVLRFGQTPARLAAWGMSAAAAFLLILLIRRGYGAAGTETGVGRP